jgi:hypothetical protein
MSVYKRANKESECAKATTCAGVKKKRKGKIKQQQKKTKKT